MRHCASYICTALSQVRINDCKVSCSTSVPVHAPTWSLCGEYHGVQSQLQYICTVHVQPLDHYVGEYLEYICLRALVHFFDPSWRTKSAEDYICTFCTTCTIWPLGGGCVVGTADEEGKLSGSSGEIIRKYKKQSIIHNWFLESTLIRSMNPEPQY